jgi:Fe-Mn family superoxide dismutase
VRNEITRRQAIGAIGLGGASLLVGCGARAVGSETSAGGASAGGEATMTFAAVLTGNHQVLPLPFAASSLRGISERLVTSHHENNYGGAVRNLNRTEQELSQITADTPPLVVAALRERELTFRNSKSLHELYFANLGGDGRRSGAIETALAESYGSSTRWDEHLRMTAMGLGGGSGWVVLSLELETGSLRTTWSGHHTQALAHSVPLLVLDLYEHSYQMDFGAAVARYLDAFADNVSWDEVNRRLELALRLRAMLTSG